MRTLITALIVILLSAPAAAADGTSPAGGELRIEIHSPPADLTATGSEPLTYGIEGVASTIGGVRYIDMMLVMDTSASLRDTDPDGYRTLAAVGLIDRLSPKSDIRIGLIGFHDSAELLQPLTDNRDAVIRAIRDLKRRGGTDLAEGIATAVAELDANGREDASRVIVLFTDGMSNEKKAKEAAELARAEGIAVQTLLLGENLKGGFLLEEIARVTGGGFVWVLDPTELPEAFLNLRTTGVDTVTLSVNGSQPVPADFTAGVFSGTVPLTVGENRIVALATSLDGQTRESAIVVNVGDASCAALEVAATHDGLPAISLNERAVEIVVDASRSMWGQIDGISKMEIAKQILHGASASLPDDLDLALRAYGNTTASEENNCSDSGLLVPFGLSSRQPIRAAIDSLKPRGQTPIAYALRQAAADFGPLGGEQSLVLVTDGIESCGGDPVAAARELADRGITIHVIGFGIGNVADEDAASLKTIAYTTGGRYFTANSADELQGALDATVGTRYLVYDGADVVASGVLGSTEPMYLPSGDYRIRFQSVPRHEVDVHLAARDKLSLMMERQGDRIVHSEYRDMLEATSCDEAVAATRVEQLEQARTLGAR